MRALVDPAGRRVADIGCGGGIYTRAWLALGADRVTGVDFSRQMIADARAACSDTPGISFVVGDATHTGLPERDVDVVFARALVHHLPDLAAFAVEAFRLLVPDGVLIVQDRTVEDVRRPASPQHLRGYFFEVFPQLLVLERERRPDAANVTSTLEGAGFAAVATTPLTETRRTYASPAELRADLRARTGRSILHALSDGELGRLIDHVGNRVASAFPLTEQDHWTIWSARKNANP